MTIDRRGKVTLRIGLAEYGTGARSGLAQIAAEILGVALGPDSTRNAGHTDLSGQWRHICISYSRHGGNAVKKAATILRKRLDQAAAELFQCDPSMVEIREGVVGCRSNSQGIALRDLIKSCLRKGVNLSETAEFTAAGVGFDEETSQGTPYLQYTFGAVVAEAEVDTLLGVVTPLKLATAYDAGKAVNPLLVEGQIEGGAAQALGYALMEELVHKDGVVLNPSLGDYYVPTSLDVPEIGSFIVERPGALGPYGAKSMGEPPIDAPAPALINAIAHAVGVRIKSLPATAEKIISALEQVKS